MTTEPAAAGPAWSVAARVGYGMALVALVAPRLHSGSALWLDEALSVNIARLPVPDLLQALRHDGSPPVYYLLLHAWISVFGVGDLAVRSLSTVCSLLALPVTYLVGLRLAPRDAARTTAASVLLVVAASPFAIRYATETRMYSLVMLLTLCGLLASLRALESPTVPRLLLVSLVAGLLALTHYWTFFFLAAGELVLLYLARRDHWRGPTARVAMSLPLGAVLFVPWLPSFVYQSRHTGTPWRPPPTWVDALSTWFRWDGPGAVAAVLGVVGIALSLLSLRDRAGRQLLALGLGGLAIGLIVSRVQGSAYALRYGAPLVVPVLLATGVGLASLPARARYAAGAAVTVLSLSIAAFTSMLGTRTQAAETAALLDAETGSGDVVVYCPDQLGPAVDHLVTTGVREVVYPTMASPELVDWVDYAARNEAASPADFAAEVNAATTGTIWLLRADGYLTFGDQCAELDQELAALRGGRTVRQLAGNLRDGGELVEYPS